MGYLRHDPWRSQGDKLRECFDRLEAPVGTYGAWHGNSSEQRPYHFYRECVFNKVEVIVNFEHEDDDHLRYSARIEEHTAAHRELAAGPTGLIDVRSGLEASSADVEAAFGKIIGFLESRAKLIRRANEPHFSGLSGFIADFWRSMTS